MNNVVLQNIDEISRICKEHHVKQLYAFGSVCTDKFDEKSDIDFIIVFNQRYFDGYVENFLSLEDQLTKLLHHPVDLIAEETIQNPYFIKVSNQTKTHIYG